jgi:hypothetical protein
MNALNDLVKGLKSASGSGIKPTTITTYKLADTDDYFEEETYQTRLVESNGFNTTQLLEIFDREQSLKYFIVIGGSKTIENIIVSANRNSMLLLPRKWIVIITEPVTDNQFWDRMNPIFSVTDVAIVRRELSVYSY